MGAAERTPGTLPRGVPGGIVRPGCREVFLVETGEVRGSATGPGVSVATGAAPLFHDRGRHTRTAALTIGAAGTFVGWSSVDWLGATIITLILGGALGSLCWVLKSEARTR